MPHALRGVAHLPRDLGRLARRGLRAIVGADSDELAAKEAQRIRETPIRPGSAQTLPGQLVVSLTSYPPRFPALDLTLRTLLSQDMRADAVVLWLAVGDAALLPPLVTNLVQYGLMIRECEDAKSFNKLVPTLAAYPDAFIITADDDTNYPPGWLGRFVSEYRSPDEILCQNARRIVLGVDDRPAPYEQWRFIKRPESGPTVFPLGNSGILYPPRSLSPETSNRAAFMDLCPHADDVWFFWMGARQGSTHRLIARQGRPTAWLGSASEVCLWDKNKDGGNDRQIAALLAAYGMPHGRSSVAVTPPRT